MPRSKTRAIGRPRPENLWGSKALRARVRRLVFAKMKAHQAAEDAQRQSAVDAAQEKAPGLATEGSVDLVIPDRRATRLSGMTAFTD
jgi:ribosomal protein S3AE